MKLTPVYDVTQEIVYERHGFFGRILDRITPRNIKLNQALIRAEWESKGEPTVSGVNAEDYAAAYESEAWVYACVSAIAEDVSGLPVRFSADGETVDIAKTPMKSLMYPNKIDTWSELIYVIALDYKLTGDWYLYYDGDELLWMPSCYTYALPDRKDRISGYVVEFAGKKTAFATEDVIHCWCPGPRSVVNGLSPLDPLKDSIQKYASQVQTEKGLWRNNTSLGGILKTEQVLTDDQRVRELTAWKQNYMGAKAAGRVALLGAGVDWKPTGMSMRDAEATESYKRYRETVMSVFRVPPTRLGLPEANYALAKEQKIGYWNETVAPLARKISQKLTRGIFGDTGLAIELDLSAAMYVTLAKRELIDAAVASTAGKPVLTQNEARNGLLGLDYLDSAEADRLDPISRVEESAILSQKAGGKQVLTQNEARAELGYGPIADESADEIAAPALPFVMSADVGETRGAASNVRVAIEKYTRKRLSAHDEYLRTLYDEYLQHTTSQLQARCDSLAQYVQDYEAQTIDALRSHGTPISYRGLADSLPQLDVSAIIESYLELMRRVFERVGQKEYEAAIEAKDEQMAERGLRRVRDLAVSTSLDMHDPLVIEMIESRVLPLRASWALSDGALRKMIADAVADGKSIEQIVSDLKRFALSSDQAQAWSSRLARSESQYAANNAADFAMLAAGAKTKQWVHSQRDEATARPSHVACDALGEVPFDHRYAEVGGMRYPHDSGPASEVCNCQCLHIVTEFSDDGYETM